jgi:hypothetical protein
MILGMGDLRKLCCLSEDAVEKITNWMAENGYTLNSFGWFWE